MKLLLALLVLSMVLNLSKIVPQAMAQGSRKKSGPLVPAVLIFGDSIMDTGNNNDIKTVIKCNFPPYGINFTGHQPTGRFSNGKIASDFIASVLGIKEYVPAYLGTELSNEDLLTGVSFASGGTGYDPLTSELFRVISLDKQIEMFKEYKEKVRAIAGDEKATTILAESLYVICVGSNDISNLYFATPFRKIRYDIPSYANLLVGFASGFVQKLLGEGAKRVVVVGIPPIGCVPWQKTVGGGHLRRCAEHPNQLATLFNRAFDKELQSLQQQNSGTLLLLADIYPFLLDITQHPAKYGFEISSLGCCGTGKFEVAILCNSITASVCDNISNYVFWDSFHPTEKAYKILVDYIYKKYIDRLMLN